MVYSGRVGYMRSVAAGASSTRRPRGRVAHRATLIAGIRASGRLGCRAMFAVPTFQGGLRARCGCGASGGLSARRAGWSGMGATAPVAKPEVRHAVAGSLQQGGLGGLARPLLRVPPDQLPCARPVSLYFFCLAMCHWTWLLTWLDF